jgi:hypothetical protein
MKKADVPQDLKYYRGSVIRDLAYAVNDEGHYEAIRSDGWEPKTEALEMFLDTLNDQEERNKMELLVPTEYSGYELQIDHRHAAHCENGTISSLLRYYGINLSEPMVFGLASGLFFAHLTFVKMGGMPVTAFRTFPGVLFKRITRLLGIKSASRRFLNKEKSMRKLDQLIMEERIPVGCVVGIYDLPYYPPENRFRFNGHNICVIGKDEARDEYRVLDSNATEKVTISRDDLLKVRFAKGTYPLMGQMYWIKSVPESLPERLRRDKPDVEFLRPLVLKAIKDTCRNMTSQPKWFPYVGANGIMYLARRMRTWERERGRRRARIYLVQVIRMLEEIGTGGAGFRFVYGAFLQEASEWTGIAELNDYSLRITEIGDQWRDFGYKASKVFKRRAGDGYTYDDLADLLEKIGDAERKFFLDLQKAAERYDK